MTSLGTTLLIRARIKSPATLALECDAAHPHHHHHPPNPNPGLCISFVRDARTRPLASRGERTGKDGQGRVGLEMRPARLRRNPRQIDDKPNITLLLSWCCVFPSLLSQVRLQGCITLNSHIHMHHMHTRVSPAPGAPQIAQRRLANKPPLRPSQWMVSQPREPEHARKREEHPHQSTDYPLPTHMSDLLSRKSLRYQKVAACQRQVGRPTLITLVRK